MDEIPVTMGVTSRFSSWEPTSILGTECGPEKKVGEDSELDIDVNRQERRKIAVVMCIFCLRGTEVNNGCVAR